MHTQDAAASESMDAAMRLIHLNPLMRQAVKLIRGVQLGIEEERLRFAVFSAISWFKVRAVGVQLGDMGTFCLVPLSSARGCVGVAHPTSIQLQSV